MRQHRPELAAAIAGLSLENIMKGRREWSIMALAALCLSVPAATAETLTFATTTATGSTTPNPPWAEMAGTWTYYGTHSTVSPGKGARTTTSPSASFAITPTLQQAGGVYQFDITHGQASGVSTDVVVNITSVSGGTLVDGSGNPVTSTTAFQQPGANTWEPVGTLKLNPGVTTPTITFTTRAGYTNRLYVDGFRLTSTDPCATGLPVLGPLKGPLAAGQTQVVVSGVDATATKLTVYANGVSIGERASGVVAGDNTVSVSPLVKGAQLITTQWNSAGIESCKATTGSIVGGGANPNVRIVLNIRDNFWVIGPIGKDGTDVPGDPFFLGSDGRIGGIGTAPSGGRVVAPGKCWQTVSFLRGLDSSFGWTLDNPYPLYGDFGVLDGIGIALEGGDNGPYVLYIDNVVNGNVLIQDFESGTGTVMFTQPSSSDTTRGYLMPNGGPPFPDTGMVTTENADSGAKSFKVAWQFKDTSTSNWLLLTTHGTGTPQPVVDLRLPISFRLLLLPVGQTIETGPTISAQPQSVTVSPGASATFQVTATGTGTLTYQWLVDGQPAGGNAPTLTLTNLTRAYHGTRVSVNICDSTGSTHSADAIISVPCWPFWADYDGDNDVDQSDFAAFQLCFADPGITVGRGDCACFDRHPVGNPDSYVDLDDLAEFEKCATGPMIPWSQALTPSCVP